MHVAFHFKITFLSILVVFRMKTSFIQYMRLYLKSYMNFDERFLCG